MELNDLNKELLHNILGTQSFHGSRDKKNPTETSRMRRLLRRTAGRMAGVTVVEKGNNLYITKGEPQGEDQVYPCMVAHMDTVHPILPKGQFKVLCKEGVYFGWNPVTQDYAGIGGDDKVGIFIAMSALERFDHIKIAFFYDEEIGLIGADEADMSFFDDVGFVLECDRQGYQDFVTTIGGMDLGGKDWKDAIAPILATYKYRTHYGAGTDVAALKRNGLKVACANMSCGYYNPHSSREFIEIEDMLDCAAMCFDMIEEFSGRRFAHEYKPYVAPVYNNTYKQGAHWQGKGVHALPAVTDNRPTQVGFNYHQPGRTSQGNNVIQPKAVVVPTTATKSDEKAVECLACDTTGEIFLDPVVNMYICAHCMEYIVEDYSGIEDEIAADVRDWLGVEEDQFQDQLDAAEAEELAKADDDGMAGRTVAEYVQQGRYQHLSDDDEAWWDGQPHMYM